MVGEGDLIVPPTQQLFFADVARAAGNHVGVLVFEGASHGIGGDKSAAGRAAIQRFLAAQKIPLKAVDKSDPEDELLQIAAHAFGIVKDPTWALYSVKDLDAASLGWLKGTATVQLPRSSL